MASYSVYDLANDIFVNEFYSDTGVANLSVISGWLSANIGALNTKIYTDYSVTGGYFIPTGDFKEEEYAIYKQMYLIKYYGKKSLDVMNGVIEIGGSDWITLKEGDSVITRSNKNEIAKTFRGLATDAKEELNNLIASYASFKGTPVQVAGIEAFYTGYARIY
jgi:hypothetical protein